ncbi:hypothetical protein [Brumimicrobium glaciale]|nr:hypothetical protein [Brumimicrobium glaciale]
MKKQANIKLDLSENERKKLCSNKDETPILICLTLIYKTLEVNH